ncbi:MAG: hypothetical protein GX937_08745 [Lentisphaerae bacterium]|jgi:hypothetical protein|nr:hypothetical protein [Lentisphaerota bacterium]
MCKRIGTDMVLYYALSKQKQISSKELSILHKKLISKIQEVLVDTTLHSIQEVVREQKSLFEIHQSSGSYTINKLENNSKFFDDSFLDRCYAPFFEEEEFKEIKEILTSANN